MAAPTIATTSTNKATYIKNGMWARPITIPTWNKVRVGIRCSINDSGGGGIAPTMGIGLCKGTTNILGDASTDFFLGGYINAQGTSYGNLYSVSRIDACAREGTTNTLGAGTMGAPGIGNADAGNWSAIWYIDITKNGAGQSKVDLWWTGGAGITSSTFYANMEVAAPGGWTHGTERTVTHALPATDLNAVCCYWNLPAIGMYVLDVAVAILS